MNRPIAVRNLMILLGAIALTGYGLSLISIGHTMWNSEMLADKFCLTNVCIKNWSDAHEYPLAIAKATSDFLVAIATAGGIVVALLSYFSSVGNAALANHISHYSTFQSYLNSEISKRNRISPASIDTFLWYNLIFPESKDGRMLVSQEYKKFLHELNDALTLSNNQVAKVTEESFRYKPHQERVQAHLRKAGIEISLQPRIEFYEIEGQVFSLIACVNKAFCCTVGVPEIISRRYI